MIGVLVYILIVVLVAGLIFWALGYLGVPQPWLRIAQVILIVIVIILLLRLLLPMTGVHGIP